MGGAAKVVTSAVSSVASAATDAVKTVSKVVQKTAKAAAKTVSNVIKNPLPVIETVALTAVTGSPALASAVVTAANGGDVKQVITAAVTAEIGKQTGQTVGAKAASATESQLFGRIASAASGASTATTLNALARGQSLSDALSAGGKALVVAGITSGTIEGIKGTFAPTEPAPIEERSVGVGTETPVSDVAVGDASADAAAAAAAKPESLGLIPTESKLLASALYPAVYTTLFGQTATPSTSGTKITPAQQPTKQPTPVQTTVTPGSQALAQALRIGDVGAPIFGGDKEEGRRSGWNIESLRYTGNSEA